MSDEIKQMMRDYMKEYVDDKVASTLVLAEQIRITREAILGGKRPLTVDPPPPRSVPAKTGSGKQN